MHNSGNNLSVQNVFEEDLCSESYAYKLDLSGKNILVVEDNDSNYYFLEILLSEMHANVTRCNNGKQAVDVCNKQIFDLIFMDLKLPEMDGYEATIKIKSMHHNAIIIAQTAYAMEGDREKALSCGIKDYLVKPIRTAEIMKVLVKYLVN